MFIFMKKFKKHEIKWPEIDKKYLIEENIKIVVQINGKKED